MWHGCYVIGFSWLDAAVLTHLQADKNQLIPPKKTGLTNLSADNMTITLCLLGAHTMGASLSIVCCISVRDNGKHSLFVWLSPRIGKMIYRTP